MMKMLRKKRKGGFTLIELIVVIAILGILAAIAIPRLANIQTNSKIKADQATANQIIKVARIIEADNSATMAQVVASYPATNVGDWTYGTNTTVYINLPASAQSVATTPFVLTVDTTDTTKYRVDAGTFGYVEP